MFVQMKIETVTPEGAAKILASNNVVNRKLREKAVAEMARDIRQGLFNGLNGETIKFGEDGQLKDGQHRLAAIVAANIPIELAVMYNVNNNSQITIDMGTRREYHDILHMRGEKDAITLAAIIKQVAARELGFSPSDGRRISFVQLDRIFERYPEIRTIAVEALRLYRQSKLFPQSVLGLCVWMFSQIDEEDASEFIARAVDGQSLEIGNPIYTLRKKLTILREHERAPSAKTVLAFTIIAWNAWRDGKELHMFRFRAGGSKPDALPEPR